MAIDGIDDGIDDGLKVDSPPLPNIKILMSDGNYIGHYLLLGISMNAISQLPSEEQDSALAKAVSNAFRKLALTWSDDKPTGNKLIYQLLVTAKEVLSDRDKRVAYQPTDWGMESACLDMALKAELSKDPKIQDVQAIEKAQKLIRTEATAQTEFATTVARTHESSRLKTILAGCDEQERQTLLVVKLATERLQATEALNQEILAKETARQQREWPKTADELATWLNQSEHTSASFQHAQAFLQQQSPDVKKKTLENILDLTAAGYLSFADFEKNKLDLPLLYKVVFSDTSVCQFLKTHLPARDRMADIIYTFTNGCYKSDITKMQLAVPTTPDADCSPEKLEQESLLAIVLTQKHYFLSVDIDIRDTGTKAATSLELGDTPKAATALKQVSQSIKDCRLKKTQIEIHEYLSKAPLLTMENLNLHLGFMAHFLSFQGNDDEAYKKAYNHLMTIYYTLIEPLELHRNQLAKKTDQASKDKTEQLDVVIADLQDTITHGVSSAIDAHKNTLYSQQQQKVDPLQAVNQNAREAKVYTVCQEAYNTALQKISDHANSEKIGKHRNTIGAFLKGVIGTIIGLVAVVTGLCLSKTIRHGLRNTFFSTKTNAILRSGRDQLEQETEKLAENLRQVTASA